MGTESKAWDQESRARLSALALPIYGEEGDVSFLPYSDTKPYVGGEFLTNFDELLAQGSVFGRFDNERHHLACFLAEFRLMDGESAATLRRVLLARFKTALEDWDTRAAEAGACAFLLRDAASVDALYETVFSNPHSPIAPSVALAFNALRDSAQVRAFVDLCEAHADYLSPHSVDYLDAPTLLLNSGADYVPTLIHLLERPSQYSYNRGVEPFLDISIDRAYESLPVAPTLVGNGYLLARGEERRVTPLLFRACESNPSLMLQAALDRLSTEPSHSMAADVATRILRAKRSKPAGIDKTAVASLPLSKPSERLPSTLPPCLEKPPWNGPKPLARPIIALTPPLREETDWPEGLRERWLYPTPYSSAAYLRGLFGPLFYRAHRAVLDSKDKEKGEALVEELITHLGDGSRLDPIALVQAHVRTLPGRDEKEFRQGGPYWLGFIDPRLSLPVWNAVDPRWWKLDLAATRHVIAAFGADVLDSLLARCGLREVSEDAVGKGKSGRRSSLLRSSLPLASSRLVPVMAHALAGRQGYDEASLWVRSHVRLAVEGLIPLALRKAVDKKDRLPAGALRGLSLLCEEGERPQIEACASEYGEDVLAAVAKLLDANPLALQKAPKMPKWLDLNLLPPLRNIDGDALHAEGMRIALGMLAASTEDSPYAALDVVRTYCTPESRDAFAWALFREWVWAGAPPRDKWAFETLGRFGAAKVCRKLAALMHQWPSDGLASRAKAGVQVLADIGSEGALLALYGLSEKAQTKGLKNAAAAKTEAIAKALGLSADELADRLIPDLGLDADGRIQFDVGATGELPLAIGIGMRLVPFVMDAGGERHAKFPKASGVYKTADKAKLAEARAVFKSLGKESVAIAKHALSRLESAMVQQRGWTLCVAKRCFFDHPVMREVCRTLLWVSDGDGESESEGTFFRITEDGTFADLQDQEVSLSDDTCIRLFHPAEARESERDAARRLFQDYELLQPFEQLMRPVHAQFTPQRWEGQSVPTSRVFALTSRWERTTDHATKVLARGKATLHYAPGLYGGPNASPTQTLTSLRIDLDADSMTAVDVSELVHDLAGLCDLEA